MKVEQFILSEKYITCIISSVFPTTKEEGISFVYNGLLQYLSKCVCIIDVGITRVKSDKTKSGWKLLGDVAFSEVAEKCSFITPVPGGVGPMTIAMLLKNTIIAAKSKI